jgi:uncharacterized protein YihD (DUF1040 family)
MEELSNTALFKNILQGITDPVLLYSLKDANGEIVQFATF